MSQNAFVSQVGLLLKFFAHNLTIPKPRLNSVSDQLKFNLTPKKRKQLTLVRQIITSTFHEKLFVYINKVNIKNVILIEMLQQNIIYIC